MGKVRKIRKHAAAAAKKASPIEKQAPSSTNMNVALSRGQRKRQKRKEEYQKKQLLIKDELELKAKEAEAQKNPLERISSLQDSLFYDTLNSDAKEKKTNTQNQILGNPGKSGKARKMVMLQEVSQLKAVHQHPGFKKNAFQALQQHLKNTLVPKSTE